MGGVYNSKHGDDMKLVLYCTHGWALKNRGGWGGRSPPHLQTRNDPRFPYCTHGDDMMFVFSIASMDGLYNGGGVGGGAAPPICTHKDPGNLPQQRTWR